jgi:prepilin-type N-terminal cleavage/methylation domain-containing protein
VRGFTLIEVLVVMVISAILLAVAVPAFQGSIASVRATEAANSLMASLELARSEAVKRGQIASVCRVADSTVAVTPAAAGAVEPGPACSNNAAGAIPAGDWAAGWQVFADGNAAGVRGTVDADEPRVQMQQVFAGGARPEIVTTAGAVAVISYLPSGLRVPDGAGETRFQINFPQAPQTPLSIRCVCVNGSGQVLVRAQRAACPAVGTPC